MYYIRLFITGIFTFASLSFCQTDTTLQRNQTHDTVTAKRDSLKLVKPVYSPGIAAASSMLFPGAGQVYTKHYVWAAVFPLAEVFVGLFGYQRFVWEKEISHKADSISYLATRLAGIVQIDSSKAIRDTAYPSTAFRLEADLKRFDKFQNELTIQQCILWMAGIYYYNIMDALHATKAFTNDDKKDPAKAWKLALVPGLGLGQMYNGELSKAGMVTMVQWNFAFVIINYQRLINECDKHLSAAGDKTSRDYSVYLQKGYDTDWNSRKKDAFRNRNMWIWYTAGFYIYSILDAMVDSHLHDANIKMRIEPELVPQSKQLGLSMTVPF